jgi:Zn-dependent alcohol dehydrogenase
MSSTNARAIVCRDTLANGGWKMEDVSVRKPGEGELLIDMVASVCLSILLVFQQ